jgi:Cu/Ag efflux protein CusF
MGSRVRMTMVGVAMIGAATGTVWAQTPPPRPSPGMERPAGELAPTTTGMVEGTVSKIDPTTGKMRVSSGLFGLFGKTLEVSPETQISVDGRDSTLAGIREGAKVKASYVTRDGRLIATEIQAMAGEQVPTPRSS